LINRFFFKSKYYEIIKAWSLADTPENRDDFNLTYFSLKNEEPYILKIVELALNISKGNLKIMGSPWSAPAVK
jgi:O-glycosyl hydrolase